MKVLAVSGARADWGLLAPVLALLRDDLRFDLSLAVSGQHLATGSSSLAAIQAALVLDCSAVSNPFGDSHASQRIFAWLAAVADFTSLV